MPIEAEWDGQRSIWRITVGQRFSLTDISDLIEKSDWRGRRRYLWDLRELREGPDSTDDVRRAASLIDDGRELWDGGRAAILVGRELDYGIARMFEAYADGVGVDYEIFRDLETALGWLGAGSES